MDSKVREAITDWLVDGAKSTQFGDGLEEMYLREGATFPGYNNMTDQELRAEFQERIGCNDPVHEEWVTNPPPEGGQCRTCGEAFT